MSENGEIYTAGKNFTLPPALTAWTNSTSDWAVMNCTVRVVRVVQVGRVVHVVQVVHVI